jgi:hypothetical protein
MKYTAFCEILIVKVLHGDEAGLKVTRVEGTDSRVQDIIRLENDSHSTNTSRSDTPRLINGSIRIPDLGSFVSVKTMRAAVQFPNKFRCRLYFVDHSPRDLRDAVALVKSLMP